MSDIKFMPLPAPAGTGKDSDISEESIPDDFSVLENKPSTILMKMDIIVPEGVDQEKLYVILAKALKEISEVGEAAITKYVLLTDKYEHARHILEKRRAKAL